MRPWMKWAIFIFIVLIIFAPAAAAGLWTSIAGVLHQAIHSLASFSHQVKH